MIIENDNLDHSFMVLPKTLKFDKKIFEKVLQKIQKTKKEPFGRFYLFVLPHVVPSFLKQFKEKNVFVKSVVTDGKLIRMEF